MVFTKQWTFQSEKKLSLISAFLVFLIGFLTSIEYFFNVDLGVETFLCSEKNFFEGTYVHNRMALNTALNFVLTGISLMLIDMETKKGLSPSQLIISIVGFITLMALEGHIYNVSSLYTMTAFAAMPLDALITFIIVFAGVLLARPDRGIMKIVASDTLSGIIARRMLATVITIPFLIDIIVFLGKYIGLYEAPLSDAMAMMLTMTVLIFIVLQTSKMINTVEIKRKEAEEQIEFVARFPGENPNPVLRVMPNSQIIYSNKASQNLLPYIAVKNNDIFSLNDKPWEEMINDALVNKTITEVEIPISGSTFLFTIKPMPDMNYINLYGYNVTQRIKAEESLRNSECKYRKLMEQAADGIMLADLEGNYTDSNTKACEMLGFTKDEILKLNVRDIVDTEDLAKRPLAFDKLKTGQTVMTERKLRRKNGTVFDVEISAKMLPDNRFQAFIRDITERKSMEAALNYERNKLLNILDTMQDGIYIVNQRFEIEYANPVIINEFGKFENTKCFSYFHGLSDTCPWCRNMEVFKGETVHWEFTMSTTQKTYDILDTPLKNPDGSISKLEIFRDITDRKSAEEKLKKNIIEKELLLKEMHHRVKNNLQLVSGLLGLQLLQIEDNTYRHMFEESQNRIKSIALIHEKLYSSENIAHVDMKDYISNLSTDLVSSLGKKNKEISLNLDIETIYVGIDIAIPCGLIINELFTNILKHAFPGDETGQINISLKLINDTEFELILSDNGTGLPENIDLKKPQTLGLTIVGILVDQLKAVILLDRAIGTKYTIRLKK
ncbi:MAG: PAS domain S-box protein [Nitrospirae bacterium YQR-1]